MYERARNYTIVIHAVRFSVMSIGLNIGIIYFTSSYTALLSLRDNVFAQREDINRISTYKLVVVLITEILHDK